MNIIIKGKNLEITPSLKEYITEKISKLAKYLENISEVNIVLSVIKGKHKIEVTVYINGTNLILRGEETSADMYTSIDLVVEKLINQIRKYKTKIISIAKKVVIINEEKDEEENLPKIVKTKKFAIKPMSTEEAVMQMTLIGHDFFVFFNAKTEEVNVVYKRKDGNFGLIEPIFD